jgi:hypothetical protein
MFRVEVENLEDYFGFDQKREPELRKLDEVLLKSAPHLTRYFHPGTPAGRPGMRFKMIGYGKSFYIAKNGQKVEWPVVGVALQKNYISVYLSVNRNGAPLSSFYVGRLGASRMGENNLSFEKLDQLHREGLAELFSEAERIFVTGNAARGTSL